MTLLKETHLKDRILTDQERKNLTILDAIRKNGPISRTDISHLTGFNVVTTSNYINRYIEKGIVFEKEMDESTGGRRPVLCSLNTSLGYVIGIGLHATSITVLLMNLESRAIQKLSKERKSFDYEASVAEMIALTKKLIQDSDIKLEKIIGIGIGTPGVFNEAKHTIQQPGILVPEDFSPVDLKGAFEKAFEKPVLIENDANTAALAEKWLGLGRDIKHLLYMFSGVACGVLINDEIYRGANGTAGELGIVVDLEDGDKKILGPTIGCWELDLGMIRKTKELISQGKQSVLAKKIEEKKEIAFDDLIRALHENDETAKEVAVWAARLLGKKVAFLVNFLNPDIVVIGGGIEELGDNFFEPLKESIKKHAYEEEIAFTRIIPSAFGREGVALGAAGMIVREIFAQT